MQIGATGKHLQSGELRPSRITGVVQFERAIACGREKL
jgi:hypothetical protein